MRVLILAVSALQFSYLITEEGALCTKQPNGILAKEGTYLEYIVLLQVTKMVIFLICAEKLFHFDHLHEIKRSPTRDIEFIDVDEDIEADDENQKLINKKPKVSKKKTMRLKIDVPRTKHQ